MIRPICYVWFFLYVIVVSVMSVLHHPYLILLAVSIHITAIITVPRLLGKQRWMRFSSLEWLR
jgi:hypothetical protein